MNVYKKISENKNNGLRQLALLIDPDKFNFESFKSYSVQISKKFDFIFVGGSLVFGDIDDVILKIKSTVTIPVVLFPGSILQISDKADAILLLSLISGRNPDLLIGNHVISAPVIKKMGIEVIPTGYMLFENGKITSVEYMSNTKPIPSGKKDIAVATALAGEMLGLKVLYLEAGSGADSILQTEIVSQISKNVQIPVIVGGGVREKENIEKLFEAGANVIVLGTVVEENIDFISSL